MCSATSASPTRPSPSRSSVSTALILAPWSGTKISWRKPFPHSGQVQVAHDCRLVLVAASSRTRRIVSTSSAAVRASAGRTADGRSEACDLSSSGSDSTPTGVRWRALRSSRGRRSGSRLARVRRRVVRDAHRALPRPAQSGNYCHREASQNRAELRCRCTKCDTWPAAQGTPR